MGPAGRQIARIQRLCCLGLGPQAVMPEIMRELQALVPSDGNTFFWAGPDLQLINMYSDTPTLAELAPVYLDHFHNRRERDVLHTFTEYMRNDYHKSPVASWHERVVKVDQREFEQSEIYNDMLLPLKWDHALQVQIRNSRVKFGALQIARSATVSDFSRRDMKWVEIIAPFVAHALADHRREEAFVDAEDRGLIIADARGRVCHLSQQAARLLLLARFPTLSPSAAAQMRPPVLPEALVALCKILSEQGDECLLPAPPEKRYRNEWGEFIFRAFILRPGSASFHSRLVGISVDRQEPLRLKLFRSVDALSLSHRQSQLCLALAGKQSRVEIAGVMGISEQTVITHCKTLYARLGVHTRAELVALLRGHVA